MITENPSKKACQEVKVHVAFAWVCQIVNLYTFMSRSGQGTRAIESQARQNHFKLHSQLWCCPIRSREKKSRKRTIPSPVYQCKNALRRNMPVNLGSKQGFQSKFERTEFLSRSTVNSDTVAGSTGNFRVLWVSCNSARRIESEAEKCRVEKIARKRSTVPSPECEEWENVSLDMFEYNQCSISPQTLLDHTSLTRKYNCSPFSGSNNGHSLLDDVTCQSMFKVQTSLNQFSITWIKQWSISRQVMFNQ